MLRRLRTQTERIGDSSATEMLVLETPQGWRVSWWPFATFRQADSAKSMLAQHRIVLQIVDF